MGYYTTYNLSIEEGGDDSLIEKFRQESEGAEYAIDDDGYERESCKWYDHEKDLREFSKKHPDVLFCLHGTGETNGDQWYLYVKNGLAQLCEAEYVFPPYDEKQLK